MALQQCICAVQADATLRTFAADVAHQALLTGIFGEMRIACIAGRDVRVCSVYAMLHIGPFVGELNICELLILFVVYILLSVCWLPIPLTLS